MKTSIEWQRAYRHVFSSDDGRAVLGDILSKLGFFANDPSAIHPECIAAANSILASLGIYSTAGVDAYMEGLGYAITLAEHYQQSIQNNNKEDDL